MAYDKQKLEKYIIDSISTEGYGVKATTNKEKLQFLYNTFKSEFGHEIARKGEVNAFKDWIQGLPGSFNIEFYNNKILELAKRIGSLPANPTEKEEDKIIDNYWNFMAVNTFKLFRKYKVKT